MIKLKQMMWTVTLFILMGQGVGFAQVGIVDEQVRIKDPLSKATTATAPSQQTQPNVQPVPLPKKIILGPAPSTKETK